MAELASSIETKRLILIRPDPHIDAHCDFLVKLFKTPEFIASHGDIHYDTREEMRQYIPGGFLAQHEKYGYGTYIILLKPTITHSPKSVATKTNSEIIGPEQVDNKTLDNGTLVGIVSLTNPERRQSLYTAPDLGFALLPEYHRQGIATQASLALLEYATTQKGVETIIGVNEPWNVASAGVFRKLGFPYHGKRKCELFEGRIARIWIATFDRKMNMLGAVGESEVIGMGFPRRQRAVERWIRSTWKR